MYQKRHIFYLKLKKLDGKKNYISPAAHIYNETIIGWS